MKHKRSEITVVKRLWPNVSRFTFHGSRRGFSLIEVLIFTSIFSLFFVTAASVVTLSLRNLSISQHKILATRYAQELEEWIRVEKEDDFDNFYTRSSSGAGTTYCFNGALAWPAAGACSGASEYSGDVDGGGTYPAIFKRSVRLTRPPASDFEVTAAITVSWQEGSKIHSVPITTIMSLPQ